MEGKKKNVIISVIIATVVFIFLIFGALACLGTFRDFDAQGYVKAMLDQTLKGEVKAAAELIGGTTEETLRAQYEAGIESFVKGKLPGGAELTGETKEKNVEICKKVFASMNYEVQEAVKVSDTEFEVPVTYKSSDIFQKYNVLLEEERQRLDAKVENSEYRGTYDEIDAQMKEEFLNNSCGLLEEAYNTMEFGEEQTIVLKVVKGENDLYKLENAQIVEFIEKILGLDAIQD